MFITLLLYRVFTVICPSSVNIYVFEKAPLRLRKMPNFEHVQDNIYINCSPIDAKVNKKCVCTDGVCGDGCHLRSLHVECSADCPSGANCSNRPMQLHLDAPAELYNTGTQKGLGVRALADIESGAFIGEFVGEVVNTEEFERRTNMYIAAGYQREYFMHFRYPQEDMYIDATEKGNLTRFLNHSCQPNADTFQWLVGHEHRLGVFARQNIKAGEEITIDYYLGNGTPCECGADGCRKFI